MRSRYLAPTRLAARLADRKGRKLGVIRASALFQIYVMAHPLLDTPRPRSKWGTALRRWKLLDAWIWPESAANRDKIGGGAAALGLPPPSHPPFPAGTPSFIFALNMRPTRCISVAGRSGVAARAACVQDDALSVNDDAPRHAPPRRDGAGSGASASPYVAADATKKASPLTDLIDILRAAHTAAATWPVRPATRTRHRPAPALTFLFVRIW